MSSKTEESKSERPNFSGKWKSVRKEGLDAFLKKVGVPWIGRKAAKTLTPTLIIEQDGDTIKETSKGFKTMVVVLTAGGPPFEHKDPGGNKLSSQAEWVGNVFTVTITPATPGKPRIKREVMMDGEELLVVMTLEDAVMRRWFARQK